MIKLLSKYKNRLMTHEAVFLFSCFIMFLNVLSQKYIVVLIGYVIFPLRHYTLRQLEKVIKSGDIDGEVFTIQVALR